MHPPSPRPPESPAFAPDLIEHRAIVPFLPMVCAAWMGTHLRRQEAEEIVFMARRDAGLSDEAAQELATWLDPDAPPEPPRLEELRVRLRRVTAELPGNPPRSLADLGLALADSGNEAELEALAVVLRRSEQRIQMAGAEACRDLFLSPPAAAEPTPLPDPRAQALEAYLEGSHLERRRALLERMGASELKVPASLPREEAMERTLEAVQALARDGYGLVGLPAAYGGEGDLAGAIATFETLALGDLGVLTKFGVQFGLFGGAILNLGTEAHHARHLEAVGRLDLPGCFAMTELAHGSNVRELETRARYVPDNDAFVLHTPHPEARKEWIGNAYRHGRMAVVFARLEVGEEDHGVHAFLVPLRDEEGAVLPGVEIEDSGPKVGLNGVDNGRIAFHDVEIPRENLLDRFGGVDGDGRYVSSIPDASRRFFTMLGTLVTGRISIAAASVSVAKSALTVAVRYSGRRRQFGAAGEEEWPVLRYRLQQRALLPALATTYGLHFAVRDLRERYGRVQDEEPGSPARREVEGLAAGFKAVASRHAMDTLQAAREACGGEGYRAANRLGRLRADADVFTTFEGANPVLLQLLARGLLTQYREEMGDLRLWGIVRYVAERASIRVSQANPVAARRTDREHLRSPGFHQEAFAYREARLLRSVARRLRDRIQDGMDSFEAVNETQDHLVRLARAHVEGRVLESFQEAVSRTPDPALSELLRHLCQLYGLARLEADSGWFLEVGYFEAPKSRAVRTEVNELCRELHDEAPVLVDAFGIPPDVLDAPAGAR